MSLTLSNQYLGLAQGPIEHEASSIVNAVCGASSLKIGDIVGILPKGTGIGFTQADDLLPRVGKISFATGGYGIVVGGDFEGIYSDGVINLDSNNLALGLIVSFFGDGVRVCIQGRCLALADGTLNGAINVGDGLIPSPIGLVKSSAIDNRVIAKALQPTAKANSIIAVDIKREGGIGPVVNPAFRKELTVLASDVTISDWFDTNFKKRIPIIINSGQVPTTQTDFPLLFNSTVTDFIGNTQDNGEDFRFVLPDKTPLDYEIESYNDSTGALVAWTKVPTIRDGTLIYLYYDNPSALDNQDPPAVWSDYKAVYHLDQNSPLGAFADSTGNFNGTNFGTTDILGKIGQGRDFNGSQFIDLGNNLNLTGDKMTLQAWMKTDTLDANRAIITKTGQPPAPVEFFWSLFFVGGTGNRFTQFRVNLVIADSANNSINLTKFFKIDGVYDSTAVKVFIDGAEKATSPKTGNILTDTVLRALIGAFDNAGLEAAHFDGIIDEVRVLDIDRSNDFIKTEFNNQDSPSTFYAIGSSQTEQVVNVNELTDFPLLVSIVDTDLRDNARADGFDIFFTKSDGFTAIPYDRESYDTTGTLVAWLLTDLTNTVDNKIFMYYGDPNSTDQQNPLPVWDTRFIDVFHYNQSSFPWVNSSTGKDFSEKNLPNFDGTSTAQSGIIDTSADINIIPPTSNRISFQMPTGSAATPSDYYFSTWGKMEILDSTTAIDFYAPDVFPFLGKTILIIQVNADGTTGDVFLNTFDNDGPEVQFLFGNASDLAFHHYAVRYTNSTTSLDIFFDGNLISSNSFNPVTSVVFNISQVGGGTGTINSALVDELQVARNANFINGYVKTSFDNQETAGQGAGNFVKVGPQQPA